MKRLTTKQAVKYVKDKYDLDYAESTFCKYRHEGSGPQAMRLGGKIYYSSEDLDFWVNSASYINTLKRQGVEIVGV
jgi:hypothetical protein